MFAYNYALEKLTAAVHSLAVGPGDVRSRLYSAFLHFQTLKTEDFPEDLRSDFEWVIHEPTKRKQKPNDVYYKWGLEEAWDPEPVVPYNLRRMMNRTVCKIAERLVDLKFRLEQIRERSKS